MISSNRAVLAAKSSGGERTRRGRKEEGENLATLDRAASVFFPQLFVRPRQNNSIDPIRIRTILAPEFHPPLNPNLARGNEELISTFAFRFSNCCTLNILYIDFYSPSTTTHALLVPLFLILVFVFLTFSFLWLYQRSWLLDSA
jgi:hypothetical protein